MPTDPDRQLALARRQLGLGLEAAGDLAGAVDEYSAALALGGWTIDEVSGRDDTPYADLARICALSEPADQVVRACTRVVASFHFSAENLADFLASRGDAHRRLGEPDMALADYNAALKVATSHPRALAGRGRARAEAGAHADAINDFRRAISIGMNGPELRLARAASLVALGNYAGAVADYDWVLADPEGLAAHPEAYRLRADAHCRSGEADAAAIGWQVWLAVTPGGADEVQDMLWAFGYRRGPMGAGFTPAALAALRAWTGAGCPVI